MQGRVKHNRLNDRQQMFCVYYLRYHSATKAYQRAYNCSYRNAHHNSWHLMADSRVQDYLSKLSKKISSGEYMTTQNVIHLWAKIAYADITDYCTFNYRNGKNRLHFKDSSKVDGTLIQSIRDGKNGAEINLPDKMRALENLYDVLPAPKNTNPKKDTLVQAFDSGIVRDNVKMTAEIQQLKAKLKSKNGDGND